MAEEVKVKLSADNELSPEMEKGAKDVQTFSSSVKKSFDDAQGASKVFTTAVFGGVAAIGGFLAASIHAAAEAQASTVATNIMISNMGEAGEKARAGIFAASQAVVKLGFDDEAAADSIARLFQRTGDLTEATKLNNLAMDLARNKNLDLTTASNMVGMVLSGNGKVLKQYGIDLKDTASPMEALDELQKKVGGSAAAYADTALGAWEVLKGTFGNLMEDIGTPFLEGTAIVLTAITDMIDTLGGFEGILNKVKAALDFLQPVLPLIAGGIIGAMLPALGALTIAVWNAVAAFTAGAIALLPWIALGAAVAGVAYLIYEAYNTNFMGFKDTVTNVIAAITPILQQFVDFVKLVFADIIATIEFVKYAWETNMYGMQDIAISVWNAIITFFTGIWNVIKGIFKVAQGLLTGDWKLMWEGVKNIAQGIFGLIQGASELFWEGLKLLWKGGGALLTAAWEGIMNGLKAIALGIWDGIKSAFTDGINWLIDKLNGVIMSYNSVIEKVPGVGKHLVIPQIPHLAQGGIVKATPGGTLAVIGEGGHDEAVVPLDGKHGVGGDTFIFEFKDNTFLGTLDEIADAVGNNIVDRLGLHLTFPRS